MSEGAKLVPRLSKEAILFEALLTIAVLAADLGPAEEQLSVVGDVIIVGNEVTQQSLILDSIKLYPGTVLTDADLDSASLRLKWLSVFGVGTSVSILGGQRPHKDILILVRETPMTYVLQGLPDAAVRWLFRRPRDRAR
jgi:hypothetical protein